MSSLYSDEFFMRQAYQLAEQAYEEDEVPIGAVVVCDFQIIGKGYNQTERLQDPSAHAEMIALTAACSYLGHKYLQDCSMYVTVEPCSMCASALRWAQLGQLIFGAREPKYGFTLYTPGLLHPRTQLRHGSMAHECQAIMQQFFATKRK